MRTKEDRMKFVEEYRHCIEIAMKSDYVRKSNADPLAIILVDLAKEQDLYSKKTSYRDVILSLVRLNEEEFH